MTAARLGWHEVLFASLLGAAIVVRGLPAPEPARISAPAAALAGLLAGAVLFGALAGRHAWPISPLGLRRALGGPPGVVLAARAASEELAWRGFLLGAVATAGAALPALLLSSGLFALAHAGSTGRRWPLHLLTGAAFGGLYLLSGRLLAAVAAHVAYNGLVAAAAATRGAA